MSPATTSAVESPFKKGDAVIYPQHGACIVLGTKKMEAFGEKREYLILQTVINEMTLKVPVDKAEEIGLRDVINDEEVEEVFAVLRKKEARMPTNWSRRFKNHVEKLKSGDIYQVAEVVRNLSLRDKEKGLSAGEKRMLNRARQIHTVAMQHVASLSDYQIDTASLAAFAEEILRFETIAVEPLLARASGAPGTVGLAPRDALRRAQEEMGRRRLRNLINWNHASSRGHHHSLWSGNADGIYLSALPAAHRAGFYRHGRTAGPPLPQSHP